MEPIQPHEYRIDPQWRRCCWYFIIAAIIAASVFYWEGRLIQIPVNANIRTMCTVGLSFAVAMSVPLRWRLRIDQNGLSRRILLFWDFWPWSDLESGRIRKLIPFTLYDPARPWWRRKLRLSFMDGEDIREVISLVNARYVLPPPPDLPAVLTIKRAFRWSAILDEEGIHLTVRKENYEYPWEDVREIRIVRIDPLRRDFAYLEIVFPNRELELYFKTDETGTRPIWQDATAEEINEFLFQHVPGERIRVSTGMNPVWSREEIEEELAAANKKIRKSTTILGTLIFLGAVLWVCSAMTGGFMKSLPVGPLIIFYPLAIFLAVYWSHRKEVGKLKEKLKNLAESESNEFGNGRE